MQNIEAHWVLLSVKNGGIRLQSKFPDPSQGPITCNKKTCKQVSQGQ